MHAKSRQPAKTYTTTQLTMLALFFSQAKQMRRLANEHAALINDPPTDFIILPSDDLTSLDTVHMKSGSTWSIK